MKNSIFISYLLVAVFLSTAIFFASCNQTERSNGPNVVEVKAVDYAFAAPDTILSGWTTFRMKNHGEEEHFMLINPLPDGVDISNIIAAAEMIQSIHDRYDSGEINKEEVYEALGNSFGEPTDAVSYRGGPGFLSMGHTVEATTFLEPGRYVIECYMRTPDGVQHNTLGMIRELIVMDEANDANAPEADLDITLTNDDILMDGELQQGTYTFAVHFEEHPVGYIGNDVHLVQLEDDTDMDQVAKWMDVFEKGGLVSPAPVEFLGGSNEMPAGNTAYFTINLEPGKYAWVTELDYELKKWKKFEVN